MVHELREEPRAIPEQLAATQEEVVAMAGEREAAVEMYHQMQLSIARRGGAAAWMITVTLGGARLPVRKKTPGNVSAIFGSNVCT